MVTQTDAQLLRRYAGERDEAAFAEVVRRQLPLVYRAALRQLGGDPHRAQEAAQRVFAQVAQKAGALAGHPSLAGWLYTTTHFTVRGLRREERRRLAREQEAFAMNEIAQQENGDAAQWAELRPALDEAMQRLGPRDREALLARFFEGRTFGEMGAQLALSEDAVRMRVERALEKLRALLARRGVTSTGAALSVLLASEAAAATPPGLAASVTSSALAAAAGTSFATSAGAVATVIHFMNTSKVAVGLAVLVLATTVATTGYELRAQRAAAADLRADRAAVFALAQRAETIERQLRTARNPAAAPASPAAPASGIWRPSPEEYARGRALMTAYPEIERLLAATMRARTNARYRKLYAELALTPAQIEAFELVKITGLTHSITGHPDENENMTFEAAPSLPPGEKENRLRALLGEANYARLEEFEHTPQGDDRVTRLASRLYFTDTPLAPAQATQFRATLDEASRAIAFDRPRAEYWAAVRERAAAFLSAPQLAQLDDLQTADEFNHARNEGERRLRAAAASSAPAP